MKLVGQLTKQDKVMLPIIIAAILLMIVIIMLKMQSDSEYNNKYMGKVVVRHNMQEIDDEIYLEIDSEDNFYYARKHNGYKKREHIQEGEYIDSYQIGKIIVDNTKDNKELTVKLNSIGSGSIYVATFYVKDNNVRYK